MLELIGKLSRKIMEKRHQLLVRPLLLIITFLLRLKWKIC